VRKQLRIMDPAWAAVDWTLAKAVRTKRFWLLSLTTFSLWGVMQHIMAAHHVAFAVDAGYSKLYASSVLSLFGIISAFASFAGLISDRIGREITLTIGTVLGISGIVVLMLIRDASHPWMLYYYTISLGIGRGLFSPTLAAAITDVKEKIGFCRLCFNLAEGDLCTICADARRDVSLICVVEQPADIVPIERTREYRGLYHVLGGALSPLDGVGPQDLTIDALITRAHSAVVKEVILALNATVDGQTTAHYITDLLVNAGVTVSRTSPPPASLTSGDRSPPSAWPTGVESSRSLL